MLPVKLESKSIKSDLLKWMISALVAQGRLVVALIRLV